MCHVTQDNSKTSSVQKNVFGCKLRQKSPLRSGIIFLSTKVVDRHGSDSPLHFDTRNIWQIREGKMKCQRSAFASLSHARALAAYLPRQDHVCITTDELFRFHKNEFVEMLCTLDSTGNPRCSRNVQPYLIILWLAFSA